MSFSQPRTAGRVGLLAVLSTCLMVVMMDNTIINVALATIQKDLSATNSQLQWAVDGYLLVYATLMVSAGVLADSHGRRRVLLIGLGIFTVASAMSAYAGTPDSLIFWRCVMGLGASVVPGTTLALIKNAFPPHEQQKALGIWAAVGAASVAFGPVVSGLLLVHFWWGSVFFINIPIVAISATFVVVLVPESRAKRRTGVDPGGIAFSMLGAFALVYGIIHGGQTSHWLSITTTGAIAAGLLLLVLLVCYEYRRAAPAFEPGFFYDAGYASGTGAVSIAFFALTGGIFLLVFYIQIVLGYSPLQLGLIILPVAVGSVTAALLSAAVAARFGPRLTVIAGLGLLIVGQLVLARASQHADLPVLEAALLAAGLGMGLVMAPTTTLVMSAVDAERSGAGTAISNTVRQMGSALGVAVAGTISSMHYRSGIAAVLRPLPSAVRGSAGESLSSTVLALNSAVRHAPAARGLAAALPRLISQADGVFISSMHVALIAMAVMLAVSGFLCWFWLPATASAAQAPGQHGQAASPQRVTPGWASRQES